MKEFLLKLINFILPCRCICCGTIVEDENGVCPDCFNKIHFISKPYCKICGTPFETTENVINNVCANCLKDKKKLLDLQRSAFIYDDFSKKIILGLKFFDKTYYAPWLAKMMYRISQDIFAEKPDLIIPVPLHNIRLFQRKYNQSALLAKELSKLSGIKTDFTSLKRCKNTIPQVNFSGKARVKNVKNAFVVTKNKNIKNKKIILIDDVFTTGSTIKECALVCKKAGASKIFVITASRTTNK